MPITRLSQRQPMEPCCWLSRHEIPGRKRVGVRCRLTWLKSLTPPVSAIPSPYREVQGPSPIQQSPLDPWGASTSPGRNQTLRDTRFASQEEGCAHQDKNCFVQEGRALAGGFLRDSSSYAFS